MATSSPITPYKQSYQSRTDVEKRNYGAFAAIKADGSVITWGNTNYGGDTRTSHTIDELLKYFDITFIQQPISNTTHIYSNEYSFAALSINGAVVTWGKSKYGGDSSSISSKLASGVASISSTIEAFAAIKTDGSVVTWGGYGGDSSSVSSKLTSGVRQVYSTNQAFAALKSDGSVITWGNQYNGGDSSSVQSDISSGVTNIYSTEGAFAALKTDGSVISWGSTYYGADSTSVKTFISSGVIDISTNSRAFAAIKTDGSVCTWGDPSNGGDCSDINQKLSSDVASVISTNLAFAALKKDGSVVTWGNSQYGGDSDSVGTSLSSGVVKIFSTTSAFAALKSNGSVITWGYRYGGGDSSYGGNSTVNTQIAADVVNIFTTNDSFAALKKDGSVVTWGGYGGNSNNVSSKVASGVVDIIANKTSFAALKSDGSVVTWGYDSNGGNSSSASLGLTTGVVGIADPLSDKFYTPQTFQVSLYGSTLATSGNALYVWSDKYIDEGRSLTTTISTTNVAQGTILYYTLDGKAITPEDFSYGGVSGSGTVDGNGKLVIYHQLANDNATEGFETLSIRVYTDSAHTFQVGTTANIDIVDTSTENNAPTALILSASSFNEAVAAGTAIATLSSLDPDASNTFSYSLVTGDGSTDNAAFSIAGNQLKITAAPDFEIKSSYAIRLRTTDQGGLSVERAVTLSVLDLNEAPSTLNLSASSFNEAIAAGSAVATLSSLDPDAGNTFTYSLVSGTGSSDNAGFSISGDQLKITAAPDFETKSTYAIRLRTTDQGGLSFEREVTLAVLNVNETPTALTLSTSSFNEAIAAGTSVATLSSLDPDASATFIYSLVSGTGANDNAAFSIAGDQLKINASPDFEIKSSYAIRLRTTDQGGLSFERDVTLTVANVNETPTALTLSASSFNEAIAAGTAVATLSSLDPDASNTFTYSLVSGSGSSDNTAFSIDSDQLKIVASPDYERKSSYAIRLRTTDQGGLSFDRQVLLSVSDVNEAPTALSLSASSFNEAVAAGTAIATLSSLDPDASNTFSYSLVTGDGSTDNAAFSIAGNQLKITASPNYESKGSYTIRLRTTDQGGLSFDRQVALLLAKKGQTQEARDLTYTTSTGQSTSARITTTSGTFDGDVILNRLSAAPVYSNQNANLSIGRTGIAFSLNVNSNSNSQTTKLEVDLAPLLDGVNTSQKRLAYFVYSTPVGQAAPMATPFTYDPVKKAGARFFDLDGNGSADTADLQFVDGGYGDKDGIKNGVVVDPSTAGAVDLNAIFTATANSLTVSDPTDTSSPGALVVRASLSSRSSSVNQIGYVALNASETLSLSYDLVKERGTLLFGTLSNNDVPDISKMKFQRDINLINGQKLMFFEVVDNTLEAMLKSGVLDSSFRTLDVSKQTDINATAGKGGSILNLFLSTDVSGLGELISSQMGEAPIFDFSSLAGQSLIGDVLIAREASYDSTIGFYKLERSDGAVRDSLTNSLILPGEVGYAAAALRSTNLFSGFGSLATSNRTNKSADLEAFKDAGLLAPFARVANTGETYFSFAAANSDGLSHFRVLGTGVLGLEDIKGGGDRDFDDLIVGFNFRLNTAMLA